MALIVCGAWIAGLALADHDVLLPVGAIIALCIAVVCQACQVVLAERLFKNDADLSVLDIAVNTTVWKNAFVWLTMPLFAMIP